MLKNFLFFVAVLMTAHLAVAETASISISVKGVQKPASDLLDNGGNILDPADAAQMAESGTDLSLLNPLMNKMWGGEGDNAIKVDLPNSQVRFIADEAINDRDFTYLSRVESLEQPGQQLRMGLSRYSHAVMMRARLLQKMGFIVLVPKYYKKLTVRFDSEEQKKTFLQTAEETTVTDFIDRKWVISQDATSLTLSNVILEPVVSDVFDIHWGFAPNPDNPKQLPQLQKLSASRSFRSLIIPYVLMDLPESLNRFSPKAAAIFKDHAVLTYPTANSFFATTYADARWFLRSLSKLSQEDLKQIIASSGMPDELLELAYAKLIHRVNNLFELFGLKELQRIANPDLNINSVSGLVQQGKVTREFVEGYPLRYSHGERTSPYNEGDLARYLVIDGKSTIIKNVLDKVNEKLQLLTMADAFDSRRTEIQNRVMDHIRSHPNEPLYQKVEIWGGPTAGFNVNASRHVATGTYFESQAPVQLVDQFTVSGSIGYFWMVDGFAKFTPNFGANLAVTRDFVHVRPLASIKEGSDTEWKNIVVPRFMKNMAEILQKSEMLQEGEVQIHPVDKFLNDLKDGEVFIISDSIGLAGYAQVSSSLTSLLSLNPVTFAASVSLGADLSRVVLKQTVISRVADGVQVYVRKMNTNNKGIFFDVNYFINLLRIRAQTTVSDIHTDAFVIKYGSEDLVSTEDQEKHEKTRDNLRLALLGLLKENDADLLYGKFKYNMFQVDHTLETDKIKAKILAWNKDSFKESHWADIRFPPNEEHPELNPADEIVSLFSYKHGELTGRNFFNLFLDFIDGFLGKKGYGVFRPDDDNPANSPYGRAKWRIINSEVDVSKNVPQLASMMNFQRVWGGWRIKQKSFFKLIDDIKSEIKDLANYEIINKSEFQNVKSVDFYRITQNISFLTPGMEAIKKFMLRPDVDGKPNYKNPSKAGKAPKGSEKLQKPNDMELFYSILIMIGEGDWKKGQKIYDNEPECRNNEKVINGKISFPKYTWRYGTAYSCLTKWMEKLIDLARNYPATDKVAQAKWYVEVMRQLDGNVPMAQFLNKIGKENYLLFVRVNGFRVGDEDGDLDYYSNTVGDLEKDFDLSNGLFQYYARKTGLSPSELDRTQGGFQ